MEILKQCAYCGKEFMTSSASQKYCKGPHYRKCEVCGRMFEITTDQINANPPRRCCSRKCSSALRKQTNFKKYGGPSPASSAEVQAKMQSTTFERYGVKHAAQSEEIKKKMTETNQARYGSSWYLNSSENRDRLSALHQDPDFEQRKKEAREKTNMDRYGVKCIFSSPEFYEKGVQTRLEKTGYKYTWENPDLLRKSQETFEKKYGADHPAHSPELQAKKLKTTRERYGVDNVMQNPDIQAKAQQTSLERYGFTNPGAAPDIQDKRRKTMKERYGVTSVQQTREQLINVISNPEKIDNLLAFHDDPLGYISSNFRAKPTMSELAKDIGIQATTLGQYLSAHSIRDAVQYVKSEMERDVYEFLRTELGDDVEILVDDRNIIAPMEIDLYLPQFKFGIECNPTATHNATNDPWGEPKDYKYHQRKTDAADNSGIFLFHLFGSEWSHKRNIVESMLRNLIGCNLETIYARKCKIAEIDSKEATKFLNSNHRQGSALSPVNLGLRYNDELVSLMTFGKMRSSIGTGREDLEDCWELVRFCSKLNTSVVGGASKLFKAFISKYNPSRIRSFSDRAHTRGTLYSALGFEEVRRSDPGYVWVDSTTDVAYHRVNAQKHNLQRFLNDDNIDLTRTERDIMAEHGYVQVFDSGTITWEWKSLN